MTLSESPVAVNLSTLKLQRLQLDVLAEANIVAVGRAYLDCYHGNPDSIDAAARRLFAATDAWRAVQRALREIQADITRMEAQQ